MQDPALLLRDIHQPPAPSWWPLAPGWWLLAGAILVVLALLIAWRWRRVRRRRQVAEMFDAAFATAATASAEVAAMSQLLRRAARRIDPEADRLQGEAWLAFLDRHTGRPGRGGGRKTNATAFTDGPGRLLLDGPFRPEVDPDEVAALRSLVRSRFLQWLADA